MRQRRELLVTLVPHMVLCLTMTFLLPISFLRKLILITGNFLPNTRERILLAISCIGLLVDPLFFYIPFIDEKRKCIGMDKKLRDVVLALRSLTDLAFALHTDAQIRDLTDVPSDPFDFEYEDIVYRGLKWISQDIIIEVLPILPIQQVILVAIFFRMNDSGYLNEAATGNVFLTLQLIARGCQIYHFWKPFKRVGKWAISAFFILMYILVGHVFGAFWYFMSIQREILCWHQTCTNTLGCVATNYCKDTNYLTNITLLDEFCPINPSNAELFDFGVYLKALQSGNTGSKSFLTKYFYTLCWGIRNLSNFGTSLETSNHLWENCFAIQISLFGLLLYIYLMGNVQTYILWETQQALDNEKEKIKSKFEALGTWMVRNGIPEEVKTEAVKIITEKEVVEKNYDADVDLLFVFNALTGDENMRIRSVLKRHLCLNSLQKVSILDPVLQAVVINALEPVVYKENSCVVQAGKSIDRMLIITEGVIFYTDNTRANVAPEAGTSSTMKIRKPRFEKGEVYGEEVLTIGENDPFPTSDRDVKCERKVEAFALACRGFPNFKYVSDMMRRRKSPDGSNDPELVYKAYGELTTTRSEKLKQKQMKILEWLSRNVRDEDLKTLVMEHMKASNVLEKNFDAEVDVKYLFSVGLSWDIEYRIKKQICINSLSKVPVLKDVNEDVLSRFCMSLEPLVLPQHSCIFYPLSVIDRMLIVVEGEITVTKTTYNEGKKETERGDLERMIKKHGVIGEELLTWANPTAPELRHPTTLEKYVECPTKVEAFALTKEGLESVVAYYTDGINKFEQLEKGRDGVADTEGASRSTTTILIQLQSDMVQQHRDEMANLARRLDEMAAFLSRMGYPAGTSPPPAA
ncbi:putative potassium channel, voltage-dependent, EAG/ELK/ERG [Rosa chinensis]|uniref:Putative potassium channel, voltage-dependent, EAG/ELK/ERG n=1 Tax=Rosa chinensis TaxID=74649 RepID=A0A2P6S9U9_ROSCH|nr:putative potassium channel, voltage-dependent, EAG/ELK/ERG [Rosa chinensis]